MSMVHLRCPHCHKESKIARSLNEKITSNSKVVVICDNCGKKFWYKQSGEVGKY